MVASAAMRFEQRLAMMGACYERALGLAEGVGTIPGIRVNPSVPQTNMMHLFFDASPEAIMTRRDAIAAAEAHWIVGDVRATEVPGWSYTEIYVGDNLLHRDNDYVLPYFRRLLG